MLLDLDPVIPERIVAIFPGGRIGSWSMTIFWPTTKMLGAVGFGGVAKVSE